MPKWALFAARDGDVLRDEIILETEEAAQAWAASRVAEEFGLDDDAKYDFDEAFGHCDGGLLEVATQKPIAEILGQWALAQMSVLSAIGEGLDDVLVKERKACSGALMQLVDGARTVE